MIVSLKINPYRLLCNNFFRIVKNLSCSSHFRSSFFAVNNSYFTESHQFLHGDFFTRGGNYFMQLLQACANVRSLDATKSLHALIITMGSNSDQAIFYHNNIVSRYLSLDELILGRKMFDGMTQRNVVSYNTMISGYSRCGDVEEAWRLFSEMRGCGFRPTQFTFGGLLSCEELDLCRGFQLQALIVRNGLLYSDAFAGTALLGLFGRNGCLHEAVQAFEEMPQKSLVTWNSMISLFGHSGFAEESMFLFRELTRMEVTLTECSIVGVLSGFSRDQEPESGEQIHCSVLKHGLDCKITVANSLINAYVKCLDIYSAEKMFDEAVVRDVVSWNIIICALAKTDRLVDALVLFLSMSLDGTLPNQTTFVSVLNSCTCVQVPAYGQLIHAKVIRNKYDSDVFVGSALIDFYSKCDKMGDAHLCFDEINEKNVVAWNALISGYSAKGYPSSFSLLQEMLQLGYWPNEFSFSSILKSSSVSELQQLHSVIIRMGYLQNDYVLSSLIGSYAKNNLISEALIFVTIFDTPLPVVPSNIIAGIYNKTGQYHETQNLFSSLEEPDFVSWNILIAACARNGDYWEAFELFRHMQMDKNYPDNYTFMSLLNVCSKLCNLALGSSVHGLIIKTDFTSCDTFVCNVLIDMYGKCGSVGSSVKIFNSMVHRNIITWTALISALGLNGYALEALQKFKEMELLGFKPDRVTFTAVLSACRHGGLVEEGMKFFKLMNSNYSVDPGLDHYHCVVDLLARFGSLKEAEQLITSMPFPPNALIWRSFLEGCKRHRTADDQAVECMNLLNQ